MDKKLSDWCFLIVSPQPFKICFKCPGWGHHSSLKCWKYETSNPKETNNLWFHWFFHIFPALMFQSMFQSYQKKSRTLPPLTQRNFGVWLKGKNWLQEDGVFVLYSSKVPACMHVCIYIYTIWLTVCYGNRVHLWRRYLYVPIKHDDFT